MIDIKNCGPAFPVASDGVLHCEGMSLRDYLIGQAMQNQTICSGKATDYVLDKWFGPSRIGITSFEIASKQAIGFADAVIKARGE